MTEPKPIDRGRWLLSESVCPGCWKPTNAAGTLQADADPPKAGDLSACGACGTLLEFDQSLRPVLLRPATLAAARLEDPAMVSKLEAFAAKVSAQDNQSRKQ